MIIRKSLRQLGNSASGLQIFTHKTSTAVACTQSRTLFGLFGRNKDTASTQPKVSNPILEEYLQSKPKGGPAITQGDLTSDSIFEADRKERGQATAAEDAEKKKFERDPAIVASVLDPDPDNRRRWERKMVIRQIRKGGRLTRAQMIKQTERESSSRSPLLKTSVKKLGALARQISGKPIEDAIVQMRFSKKKVAQDVRTHLEHAKNDAVVKRGMGLGEAEGTKGEPRMIMLKDGKRHKVQDKTGIYVDQAWVGRGPYDIGYDFRARGKTNLLRIPYTSISVVLKEEATRIRQHEEVEKKRANRKVWVHLPDRPVTTQRQYYSW